MTQTLRAMSASMQRLVAALILVLGLLLLVEAIILPLWDGAVNRIAALNDARFEHKRLQAISDRPLPDTLPNIPDDLLLVAEDAPGVSANPSSNALTAIIAQSANTAALELRNVQLKSSNTTAAEASFVVEGPQDKVLQMIMTLETRSPVIRFEGWQIEVIDQKQGTIRYSAKAIAAVGRQ